MLFRRPARTLASVPLVMTLVFLSSAFAKSRPQAAAPCKAYFTVLEWRDAAVVAPTLGLNKAQSSWYEKHGNREQFAGICFWDMAGERMSVEEFVSGEKSGAIQELDAPLYVIAWGESLVTDPYLLLKDRRLDYNGSRDGIISPPRYSTSTGSIRYNKAVGVLARWDAVSHTLVGIEPLQNHRRGLSVLPFVPDRPASASLLEGGLEAIRKSLDQGQSR